MQGQAGIQLEALEWVSYPGKDSKKVLPPHTPALKFQILLAIKAFTRQPPPNLGLGKGIGRILRA